MECTKFNIIIDQIKNNEITELPFAWKRLSNSQIHSLAEALKANATLTSLGLRYNKIGAEGAEEIAEALKVNTGLTSLNLGNNDIGDVGVDAIAEALKANTGLTSLYFGDNEIGDEGAKEIAEVLKANTGLTFLDLTDNFIGDEGAKEIAEALEKNYSIVKISGAFKNDTIDRYLERNKQIKDFAEKGGYVDSIEYFFSSVEGASELNTGSIVDSFLTGNYLTPAEQRNIHINAKLIEADATLSGDSVSGNGGDS